MRWEIFFRIVSQANALKQVFTSENIVKYLKEGRFTHERRSFYHWKEPARTSRTFGCCGNPNLANIRMSAKASTFKFEMRSLFNAHFFPLFSHEIILPECFGFCKLIPRFQEFRCAATYGIYLFVINYLSFYWLSK